MLWIKEVEMVDSVGDLKSSCSIRGTPGPDFELLDVFGEILHRRSNKLTAPESQEPMTQDHLMTTDTRRRLVTLLKHRK